MNNCVLSLVVGAAVAAAALCLSPACSRGWDDYEPRPGEGGAGATTGTGGAAAAGGSVSTGGNSTAGGGGVGGSGATGGAGGEGGSGVPPLGDDAQGIFLHHGTGSTIWSGGVAAALVDHNTSAGTSYGITPLNYPHSPYPFANYPYDYWYLWVQGAGDVPADGNETLEMLTPTYDVIIFKHCYPVGDIQADTGNPDVTSATKRVENYKAQYEALKTKMRSFPANRFIVWTGAAHVLANTTAEEAARTREFFEWVTGVWDVPGDNIFVWDFYELETEGGLYLLPQYASSPSSSGPNSTFAAQVAPLFAQRVVDVIEGRGDTGSLTGE